MLGRALRPGDSETLKNGYNGPDEPWILGARFESPHGFWAISQTPAQPDYWGRYIKIIIPRDKYIDTELKTP